jgi:hypothetical protein
MTWLECRTLCWPFDPLPSATFHIQHNHNYNHSLFTIHYSLFAIYVFYAIRRPYLGIFSTVTKQTVFPR